MNLPVLRIFSLTACITISGWAAEIEELSVSVAAAEAIEGEEESAAALVEQKTHPGEASFWAAMKLFRSKQPADQSAARAKVEASAENEFTHAQLFLAECYQSGLYGYARNLKKAAAYFRLAAERGNAFAKVGYGVVLFSGMGERKDDVKALEWLMSALAADADYTRPQTPVDFFVQDGTLAEDGLDGGIAGASATDVTASTQARAHYFVGVIQDSQKNLSEAHVHYVAAATAGVAGRDGVQQAATQAAINFALGNGVTRDPQKANEMLDHSRKLGRHSGISTIHSYATAKLVDEFAVSELEEAVAKASDESAGEMQMNIARLLTDRKSKDYNPKEAIRWFELAAESGKAWAMVELALLYSSGEAGSPDYEKAFTWWERVGSGKDPKHYLGVANLIICHENGIGTTKDSVKAREIATQHRHDELVSHLMLLGQCPKSILTFEQRVELNKHWATKMKDPQAQYLMGLQSEGGFGVKQSTKDAAAWYKKAMKAKHGPASRQLGMLYERDLHTFSRNAGDAWKKAVDCYRIGAEAGDARAIAYLATMTANGWGIPSREEEAKSLYERSLAIDPELPLPWNNLGAIYERRFREAKNKRDDILANLNRVMMMKCYEKSDQLGFAHATNNLGLLHYNGALGERDFEKAYIYFERAAEAGHREARFRLGEMHEKGEGVPVTQVEAAYHYRLAGLDGHPESLRRLVNFYLQGKGGARDMDRAQFWLVRMYENGDVGALVTYADLAMQQKNYGEAVKLFQMLKGSPDRNVSAAAYHQLSRCYRHGWGVAARAGRAKAYRQKALELGSVDARYAAAMEDFAQGKRSEAIASLAKIANSHPTAAYKLGQLYYLGEYVEKDLERGMGYLRKAAAAAQPDALYFLAATTYKQSPGAPELEEAIGFVQSAEAMGHAEAAVLREKLESRRKTAAPKPEETAGARST